MCTVPAESFSCETVVIIRQTGETPQDARQQRRIPVACNKVTLDERQKEIAPCMHVNWSEPGRARPVEP